MSIKGVKADMGKLKRRLALFRALPDIHDWLLDLDEIMNKKYMRTSLNPNQDIREMSKVITIYDNEWKYFIRCKVEILIESQERK